ncbi:hypothetical protein D3C73_1252180 [compost metagenome]
MKPTVALIGTMTERKTSSRIISDRITIMPIYTGNASDSLEDMSMLIAVKPVTPIDTSFAVARLEAGSRRSCTRSLVSVSVGPVLGIRLIIAISPVAFMPIGDTSVTLS